VSNYSVNANQTKKLSQSKIVVCWRARL